jgi:hypothetical protein
VNDRLFAANRDLCSGWQPTPVSFDPDRAIGRDHASPQAGSRGVAGTVRFDPLVGAASPYDGTGGPKEPRPGLGEPGRVGHSRAGIGRRHRDGEHVVGGGRKSFRSPPPPPPGDGGRRGIRPQARLGTTRRDIQAGLDRLAKDLVEPHRSVHRYVDDRMVAT